VLVVLSVVKYLQNPILKARFSIILKEFLTTESTKGTKMKISENFVTSVPFVVQKNIINCHSHCGQNSLSTCVRKKLNREPRERSRKEDEEFLKGDKAGRGWRLAGPTCRHRREVGIVE
jgi:hypothetical protein